MRDMSRKYIQFLLITLLSLTVYACGAPPRSYSPPGRSQPVATKPSKVERNWTFGAVEGWMPVKEADLKDDEASIVAEYERQLNSDLTVSTYLVAKRLTAEEVKSFLEDIQAEASSRDERKAKMLGQRMAKLGDVDSYEVLEVRRIGVNSAALVLSVAVTDGKVGYLASCGGNVRSGELVLAACKEFLATFRVLVKP